MVPSREQLLFNLYEAAELEHNLMCTYLYAAFSLRGGESEGLSPSETEAVERWRKTIVQVAIEEMAHLTAVWNITSALGGAPRFGRGNFPLDPGYLPAGIVVRLAPFGEESLQHFTHLERPDSSAEPDGLGFEPELSFRRGTHAERLTPMAADYSTVGEFYAELSRGLSAFVEDRGEAGAFCGDPSLQLSRAEIPSFDVKPVICAKTALLAFTTIREQGEGAVEHSAISHFSKFRAIRTELLELTRNRPGFSPAFPVAQNPVLRRPLRPEGRVWIEDPVAARTVDLANTAYAHMLRLLAYSYQISRPEPEKQLAVQLATGLMRVTTALAERAARLPVGPGNPSCHAGITFTALRDAAAFPPSAGARHALTERFKEMRVAAEALEPSDDDRVSLAARLLQNLSERAERGFAEARRLTAARVAAPETSASLAGTPASEAENSVPAPGGGIPVPRVHDGVEEIDGTHLTLLYEGKRCVHARFCVTGAPKVFLANVKGPWIAPDQIDAARLVEIAHACPSGAIRYRRRDGGPEERTPPVNLLSVRESGPYAVRGELSIDGKPQYRATLCRCGASENKPYCDGAHLKVGFAATGEPKAGGTEMLAVRDGPLRIDPEPDGPLELIGNLEITSGTGRVVTRVTGARLCRCGGSANKPFCDGTHARIGFRG